MTGVKVRPTPPLTWIPENSFRSPRICCRSLGKIPNRQSRSERRGLRPTASTPAALVQLAKEVPPPPGATKPFVVTAQIGLGGMDMFAAPTANDSWDHLTRVDLQSRLAEAKLAYHGRPNAKGEMLAGGQFPATFLV